MITSISLQSTLTSVQAKSDRSEANQLKKTRAIPADASRVTYLPARCPAPCEPSKATNAK